MCLDTVNEVKSEKMPRDKYHIGWKRLKIQRVNDKDVFCSMYNRVKQCNKWIRCRLPMSRQEGAGSSYSTYSRYPLGFHIFTKKSDAQKFWMGGRVVKVRYRRVVARGTQDGSSCVVAKEMYVIRGTKK